MSSNRIKKSLEDILGPDLTIRKKKMSKKSHEKILFCNIMESLRHCIDKEIGLEMDYGIIMDDWNKPYLYIIEGLFKLNYDEEQTNIINWWLYEKFSPDGVLFLTDIETGEEIPSDTPEDLWNLIHQLKFRNKL